jgi:hypothetical protein
MPRESVEQLAREHPDRVRLRYGPYKTPRFHYGKVVRCEVRGEVVRCGLSAGRRGPRAPTAPPLAPPLAPILHPRLIGVENG